MEAVNINPSLERLPGYVTPSSWDVLGLLVPSLPTAAVRKYEEVAKSESGVSDDA